MLKQAIILRKDLKMGFGKAVAQACHASLEAYRTTGWIDKRKWIKEGAKKIVLKVNSEEELIELYHKAVKMGLPAALIKDAGLTQLPPGTITALAIGPAEEEKIDKITGKLKLF